MSGVRLAPQFGTPTLQGSLSGAPGVHLAPHFGAPSVSTTPVEDMVPLYGQGNVVLYVPPVLHPLPQDTEFPTWAAVPLGF